MERMTNKREADAQREEYERRLANGYPRDIPEERFLRLAAYEDTGLEPDEVTALQKDWSDLCTEIGECGGIDRLRELAKADRAGRLVSLPCKVGKKDHNGCWCRACWVNDMLDEVECFQPADVAPVVRTLWAHLGGDEWCCPVCGFVTTTEGSWDKPTKKILRGLRS